MGPCFRRDDFVGASTIANDRAFCNYALGCACKIQQDYKLLPHRGGFAFGFNTPAKRPLEWNKRNNKPEQAEEQVKEQARRKAPSKTPGGKIPAGRKSRVSIS
jgi:hypothetical protein